MMLQNIKALLFVCLMTVMGCDLFPDNECSFDNNELFLGYGISPIGHPQTDDNRVAFFAESQQFTNTAIREIQPWRSSRLESGEVPNALVQFGFDRNNYCFAPVWGLSWMNEDFEPLLDHPNDTTNNSWTNNFTRVSFQTMVENFVNEVRPGVLFLSYQDDFYFEQNPNDHQFWVDFYGQLYDVIKNISPETQVGIAIHYEHISGKGILNGWTVNNWTALNRYDTNKLDLIGVTSYPFLAHVNVQSIQDDYFEDLFSQVGNTPVMLLETGWPHQKFEDFPTPWTVSEIQQQQFAQKILMLAQDNNISTVMWRHLYPAVDDCNGCDRFKTYESISLYDDNEFPLDAWNVWFEGRARDQENE